MTEAEQKSISDQLEKLNSQLWSSFYNQQTYAQPLYGNQVQGAGFYGNQVSGMGQWIPQLVLDPVPSNPRLDYNDVSKEEKRMILKSLKKEHIIG